MSRVVAMRAVRTGFGRVPSDRGFLGIAAALFAVSVTATVLLCVPMAAMPGMPMPGGWALSMTWMRMPGQPWWAVATAFLAMWLPMMAAMMLPSLVHTLWRYRREHGRSRDANRPALGIAAGYLAVWTAIGGAALATGLGIAALLMRDAPLARAAPWVAAAVVVAAGLLQFSRWKARCLACCRQVPVCGHGLPPGAGAWRQGLRLGRHCAACCAGLTAALLATGMMDLRAMAAVTLAITLERTAPAAWHAERLVGIATVIAGLLLLARTAVG